MTGQNVASDGSVPQASLNMGPILGRMRKPSFRFFPVVPIPSGSSADRLFGAKGKRPAIGVSFQRCIRDSPCIDGKCLLGEREPIYVGIELRAVVFFQASGQRCAQQKQSV